MKGDLGEVVRRQVAPETKPWRAFASNWRGNLKLVATLRLLQDLASRSFALQWMLGNAFWQQKKTGTCRIKAIGKKHQWTTRSKVHVA
jgi:hypothetical protein